ncbi:hypothetical protein ACXFAU_11925 [Paenibacillus glucanolyticus]
MDIFTLSLEANSEIYDLTEKNYLEKTKKTQPFFNLNNKKYYAICPDCKNPIVIVSLFNDRVLSDGETPAKLHGRHVKRGIEGIASYNQGAYDDCDLKKVNASELSSKSKSEKKVNEIIYLLEKYPHIVLKCIQHIAGLNISSNSFESMRNTFKNAEGYYYRRVTKWNLPYSFLYIQQQMNLYGRYINKNEMGQELKEAIKKSEFFKIDNNKIISKESRNNARIYFFITNHKVDAETGTEIMKIIVEEKCNEKINILIKKNIKIDKLFFMKKLHLIRLMLGCFSGKYNI